jgi:hypothetical protein
MKNMKYVLLALIVMLCGCKENHSFSNQSIACSKPQKEHRQKISEMLKYFRVIRLETTDQSLIGGHIGKIKKISDGYFISSDRKELLLFNSDGTFKQKIGQTGSGPGEYSSLSDYDVFKNGNIVILDVNKLIMYDREGVYIKTIPLNFIAFNIKTVGDDIMLLYSSGENYMIHEADLSGKIIKREFKNTQPTRIGKNISFVVYGNDKIICQVGRSNDCIFYDFNNHEFTSAKLLCDDIMTASEEENFVETHGLNYLEKRSGVKFIDGISGCHTHLLFAYGSVREGFTAQALDLRDKSIKYVISSDDINDVTFTSPFFMEYACLAEGQDCFITYVSPAKIQIGLEKHREFWKNPNYRKLEKMFMENRTEIPDENPCLVEFIFK